MEPDMMELLITAGVLGMIAWFSYTLGYARAKHDTMVDHIERHGAADHMSAEDAARRGM
jgi:hypothetical protein